MKSLLAIFLFIPFFGIASQLDTIRVLQQLVADVKNIDNVTYDYSIDMNFPNGNKDHLGGNVYMNKAQKLYYNNCNAFLMFCSSNWTYMADHKKKVVTIVNEAKKSSNRDRRAREKEIFEADALNKYLDTLLLKRAVIRKYISENGRYSVVLGFKGSTAIKRMELVYNTADKILVLCKMEVDQPIRQTVEGFDVAEMQIKLSTFKKIADNKMFSEAALFSFNRKRFELKKYGSYKLCNNI
jgi:hypothetical protein